MGERLFELRRRTFNTPAFRGIEFIEVEAKSIINHVPGSYLPFNWTINPYRGCSHACVYCLSGDTQILMADGRTKALADVRIGDTVYGTERRGGYRRYVPTSVLDHWSTVKPAYRITLDDGTELVASGDHRFLSERGWKYVATGRDEDPFRRYLTRNDLLVGSDGSPHGRSNTGSVALLEEHRVSTLRRVLAIEPLGVAIPMYDITTGAGDFIANGVVSHNCFARSTHTYMDMDAGRDFESKIVVKVNAAQLLRRELRAKRWKGEHIAMGTATDPYQRAEGKYRLMPGIIEALAEVGNPFSILTKGTLILRDLDLLVDAADGTDVSTALSIGTLDDDAWSKSEPGTPHPRKRMEAVAKLNDAGIPCGVMVAPVLPGITDDEGMLKDVVRAAADAGATHVTPILLHLRPKVKEVYMDWLQSAYPHLVSDYEAMYGRGSYASHGARDALGEQVKEIISTVEFRPTRPPRNAGERVKRAPEPESEQLSLL